MALESGQIEILGRECNVRLSKRNYKWEVKVEWEEGYQVATSPDVNGIDEAFDEAVEKAKESIKRKQRKKKKLERAKNKFTSLIGGY